MSHPRWLMPFVVALALAATASDAVAQRSGYRKPGLRPPDESGVFEVRIVPKVPSGFDGFTVVVHENQLVPANREIARREADRLIDLLSDQAKSQSGEPLHRTEHSLRSVRAILDKMNGSAGQPAGHGSAVRPAVPRVEERIKEVEGQIERALRDLERLRRELEELRRDGLLRPSCAAGHDQLGGCGA